MDGELLSLKWNNHRTTFLNIIGSLRDKATYTDATLACDGKFYPVHRLVLSTCSEYFSAIFDNTPCKSPVVVLKDIECRNLEFLLDYMYIGEVSVRQTELAALIKAAECLRIKGLAVPDEEPSKSSSKNRSESSRNSSPPAKRRRHTHHSEERHSRRSSSSEERLSSVPVTHEGDDPNTIHVKLEPQDSEDASASEFCADSGGLNESGDIGEDSGGGGLGDADTDGANDINSFFKSSVEKTEPVHLADYDSSDFPGPSGLQNNSLPPWESDNFQSDSLPGALSSPAASQQDQQQQQQLPENALQLEPSSFSSDSATEMPHIFFHTYIEGKKFTLCPLCPYKSNARSDVQRHFMGHIGEKPFRCKFCDYRSYHSGHVRRHTRNVHRNRLGCSLNASEF